MFPICVWLLCCGEQKQKDSLWAKWQHNYNTIIVCTQEAFCQLGKNSLKLHLNEQTCWDNWLHCLDVGFIFIFIKYWLNTLWTTVMSRPCLTFTRSQYFVQLNAISLFLHVTVPHEILVQIAKYDKIWFSDCVNSLVDPSLGVINNDPKCTAEESLHLHCFYQRWYLWTSHLTENHLLPHGGGRRYGTGHLAYSTTAGARNQRLLWQVMCQCAYNT